MSLAVKLAEARAQWRAEAAERNAENQHVLANIGLLGVENAIVLERILSSGALRLQVHMLSDSHPLVQMGLLTAYAWRDCDDRPRPPPRQRLAPVRVLVRDRPSTSSTASLTSAASSSRRTGRGFRGSRSQLTGRKSYGNAASLDEAKAALKAEYGRRPGGRFFY
jgi:hypothetical protein